MGCRRTQGKSGIYHVVNKGVGGQLIFEDDFDRHCFLGLLQECKDKCGVALLAWCLMGNHYHLIVQGDLERVSATMHRLDSGYARLFNERHDRFGHVFKGPFFSSPIDEVAYVFSAVRYIHNNPVRAGIVSTASAYKWSSYAEYLGAPKLVDTTIVEEILGGVDLFIEESKNDDDVPRDVMYNGLNLSDEEALALAKRVLGIQDLEKVRAMDKGHRNACILKLYSSGISQQQIVRLTGISRSTINRTIAKERLENEAE